MIIANQIYNEELDRENYYQEAMDGIFGEKNRELEKYKKGF